MKNREAFKTGKSSQAIQDMDKEDKAMVLKFLDLAIRDASAKKAYA